MTGAALSPTVAALWLFGAFFFFLVLRVPVAFALGLACLPVLFIEPRLSPMVVFNTTFKAYNSFILLAVPFSAHREPDECRRHHRPSGHAVANDGRQFPRSAGTDQCAVVGVLRRHFRVVDGRRGESGQDLHRGTGQGRLRSFVFDRDHRGFGGACGDHFLPRF